MTSADDTVKTILQGSVDFHIHSHMSPAYHWDLMEIGRQSQAAGMRAVVIKNLFGFSHEQCHMANRLLGRDMCYASLVFGRTTGGICKAAVEQFVQFGGTNKIVEMPVFDSARHMAFFGKPADSGICITAGGKPDAELVKVLEVIAANGLVLKTGHISPAESLALIRLAKQVGVLKIVVTHATGGPVMASVREQAEMASLGALIEHCVVKFLPLSIWRHARVGVSLEPDAKIGDLGYLKESIRAVGARRCILGTDSGQRYHPYPHELLTYFVYLLLDLGFSEEEIGWMARENPCRLLGIQG